jgi:hypothetical protein
MLFGISVIWMKSVQELKLEEEGTIPKTVENYVLVLHYELQFFSKEKKKIIHKVEVRNLDFHDVIRHLRQGDSVLITPKLRENSTKKLRQDHRPWYFTHA